VNTKKENSSKPKAESRGEASRKAILRKHNEDRKLFQIEEYREPRVPKVYYNNRDYMHGKDDRRSVTTSSRTIKPEGVEIIGSDFLSGWQVLVNLVNRSYCSRKTPSSEKRESCTPDSPVRQ